MVTMCRAAVTEELETWSVGDGLSDGLLAVRRTDAGFVVYDGEAAEPQLRRASPEEAVDFVLTIRGTEPVRGRPALALAS